MACFSEDCNFVKKNGDCFYDGVPPSNSPKTCEECRFFKPITNGDRIRAMSDEELAAWIETFAPSGTFQFWLNGKTWLQWLRQEAENERAD